MEIPETARYAVISMMHEQGLFAIGFYESLFDFNPAVEQTMPFAKATALAEYLRSIGFIQTEQSDCTDVFARPIGTKPLQEQCDEIVECA